METTDIRKLLISVLSNQEHLQNQLNELTELIIARRRADNDETGLRFPGYEQEFGGFTPGNLANRLRN